MTDQQHAPHFNAIREALAPHEKIWNHEVLHLNWRLDEVYPPEWTERVQSLDEESAFLFDTGRKKPLLSPELDKLFEELKELSQFHSDFSEKECDKRTLLFIKEKKVHEISRIIAQLDTLVPKERAKIIDIGGGLGHLARAIAFETGASLTTIDGNMDFQVSGQKRLKKLRWPPQAGEVNFHNCFIEREQTSKELINLFSEHDLSLGLHTCGNLSLCHIDLFLKSAQKAMINYGCCYNKLDPDQDINVSQLAKAAPLPLNRYALSLSTRGYAKLELKDYQLKKRVKLFRYGLHFLIESEFGISDVDPVGECHTRIYWDDFHVYARQKLAQKNLKSTLSNQSIDSFIQSPRISEQIQTMIACDLLRWQFGRSLEAYILLDRALFLEESGRKAKLVQTFDEKISPRNVALISCQ